MLLYKLKEHSIDILSITDHNRFDSNLYRAIKQRLQAEDPITV